MALSQVNGCLSCQHEISLERLLPHLAGMVVETAALTGGRLCIWARGPGRSRRPARVRRLSVRVHSRYQRRLADAAIGGSAGADPADGAAVLLPGSRTAR